MAIEDKIATTRYNVDYRPHIKVNTEACESCAEKPCLYICPVQSYVLADDKLVFNWQGCVECGACHIVCAKNAIDWNYPRGGYGVCFRFG